MTRYVIKTHKTTIHGEETIKAGDFVLINSEQNVELKEIATFILPFHITVEGSFGQSIISTSRGKVFDGKVTLTGEILSILVKTNK